MGKNKGKIYKKYETYFLIAIIFIALIMLFIFSKTPTKKIYELKKYNNGIFRISGYVSNIKEFPNYMRFTVSDSNSSISVFSNSKLGLKTGDKINFVCNLKKTLHNFICYYKN